MIKFLKWKNNIITTEVFYLYFDGRFSHKNSFVLRVCSKTQYKGRFLFFFMVLLLPLTSLFFYILKNSGYYGIITAIDLLSQHDNTKRPDLHSLQQISMGSWVDSYFHILIDDQVSFFGLNCWMYSWVFCLPLLEERSHISQNRYSIRIKCWFRVEMARKLSSQSWKPHIPLVDILQVIH